MPPRPKAPGATTAERELERLILSRQARTLAMVRSDLRGGDAMGRDSILNLASMLAQLTDIIAGIANLTPEEWEAINEIAVRILSAGVRSAQARASALSDNPRTWGEDEAAMIARALEVQRQTVAKSYQAAGVWFAEDLSQKLAEAQALGTPIDKVRSLMTDRYGVAETYANRTALQVTRAGVEQAARARMESAGVTEFIWRAVDRFARPTHLAANGNRYPLSTGHPTLGFPGEPWGCRCFQDPVIPESLTRGEQQLPGQAFQPSVIKEDPSGLPLLPTYQAALPRGSSLETLLSEMIQFSP